MGRQPEGCSHHLKSFLGNRNLSFVPPKDRACSPREADVSGILDASSLSKER